MSKTETKKEKLERWALEKADRKRRHKILHGKPMYSSLMGTHGLGYSSKTNSFKIPVFAGIQGFQRNRKATPGRRYKFIQVMKRISNPMMAMARRVIPTNSFKKHIIPQ